MERLLQRPACVGPSHAQRERPSGGPAVAAPQPSTTHQTACSSTPSLRASPVAFGRPSFVSPASGRRTSTRVASSTGQAASSAPSAAETELPTSAVSDALLAAGRVVCAWFAARGGLKSMLSGNSMSSKLSQAATFGIAFGWSGVSFADVAGVFHNYVFMVGFWAWFCAQFMKIFTYKARTGKWRLRAFVDSGGMPSSHSSLCVGTTTAAGILHGFTSSLFAMGLCFSLIVMYDAAGVRRHAGKQAQVLNMIIRDLWEGHPVSEQKLKSALEQGSASGSFDDDSGELGRQLTLKTLATQSFDSYDEADHAHTFNGGVAGEANAAVEKAREVRNKYVLERLERLDSIRTRCAQTGEQKLKEVLGHTPIQVAAGGALGVAVALFIRPI